MTRIHRRSFNATLGATAMATGSMTNFQTNATSVHEQVRLGFIGVGNRGSQLMSAFNTHAACRIVAAADVYAPYLRRAQERWGAELAIYEDYRQLLDRSDIDAVVIATPDHWHALQTVHAVMAGKDAYVEKPLSMTIREGRIMIDAAQRFSRVVQVGLQRRSMPVYQKLRELVQSGSIGKVTVARAYRLNNMFPDGIGRSQPSNPPPDLNWDLWLGPRAKRPFQDNIAPYKFRWWQAYSSQMGNWGVHYFDVIRWLISEAAPRSVVCIGGQFAVDDDRTIPDTAEAIFELPGGSLLVFGQYEASSNAALHWGELELRGTIGTAYGNLNGYRILRESPGQFQSGAEADTATEYQDDSPERSTEEHAGDFLNCVKTRQTPRCPLEEGHRSTVFAHLANISLATGFRLEWDAEKEQVTNCPAANDLLHYEYRREFPMPSF